MSTPTDLLPAWAPLVNAAFVALEVSLAMGLALGLTRAASLAGWERLAADDWDLRARRAVEAKTAQQLTFCWLGGALVAAVDLLHAGPLGMPRIPLHLLGFACLVLAFGRSAFRLERRVREKLGFRRWFSSALTWWVLFGLRPLSLLALGLACPREFGVAAALVLLAAIATNLAFFNLGFRLLGSLGLAWPARERFGAIVGRAASASGQPAPAAFELRWNMVNALALLSPRGVAISDAALDRLDDAEIEALVAHELGHLAERCGLGFRVAMAWLPVPFVWLGPTWGSFGLAAFGVAIVAGFLAWIGLTVYQRRAELGADAVAREHSGDGYARVLEKLHELNLVPRRIGGLGQSHPDLTERIGDAAKNQKVSQWRLSAWTFLGVVPGLLVVAVLEVGSGEALGADEAPLRMELHVALSGGASAEPMVRLARHHLDREDRPHAEALLLLVLESERSRRRGVTRWGWEADQWLAVASAEGGDCDDALRWLAESEDDDYGPYLETRNEAVSRIEAACTVEAVPSQAERVSE